MNLLEPLTAGVIFFIALLASLQIDAYIAQSSNGQASRQELGSAADAAMLASQALASNLSQPPNSPFPISDCSSAASALAKEINDASVATIDDITVTRSATDQGILVLVEVKADKLATRQRWLSPAAYGLCSSNS
jgi:hypothetical protein